MTLAKTVEPFFGSAQGSKNQKVVTKSP